MWTAAAEDSSGFTGHDDPRVTLANAGFGLQVLGDRKIAVCRELTKLHEEIFRGTISQAIKHFTEPRGEFTLVIEGKGGKTKPQLTEDIEKRLHDMYLSGITAKEAIATIAGETGLSRKELYRTWLKSGKILDIQKDSLQSFGRSL